MAGAPSGQHRAVKRSTSGQSRAADGLRRVSIGFSSSQVEELNALAKASNRSFSATVAYLVEHALQGRRRSQSSKGN